MMAELRKVQGQRQAAAAVPATSTRAVVRDPHPADLSRAEAYRPGRRSGRAREVPPLDFALDNLLAKIIAVQGQRAGTMANTPTDASCETKPILEEVSSEASPAATPLRLATSNLTLDAAAPAVSAAFCQTKPIVGLDERQVLCSPEVTKDSPQGEAGRAEPEEAGYRPVHCVGRPAVRS
jgi:hypothetical protein